MRRRVLPFLTSLLACACGVDAERAPALPVLPSAWAPRPVELRESLPAEHWEREGELLWAGSDLAAQGAPLPPGAEPRLRSAEDGSAVPLAGRDGARVAWRGGAARDLVLVWPTSTGRVAGSGPDRGGRVEVGGLATDGFALRSGGPPVRVSAADAAGRELRAALSVVGAEAPLRLAVRVGGRELSARTIVPGGRPGETRLSVALPEELAEDAELALEATGGPGVVYLHAPRLVAPIEVEAPGSARPDLLVLLADTFRADNLATYGGERGVTPALDAFAESALVFERAWSPASWTLPAHASLFTGLYPHQHGAVAFDRRPSDRLTTLARRLSDAGYRTCAVTDGHFVSRRFGLDEGFEWFEELSTVELYRTLLAALERIEDDDGRPLFLFVQSYRVHGPYAPSEKAVEEHGAELGLAEAAELQERLYAELIARQEHGGPEAERLRELMAAGAWREVVASTEVGSELDRAAEALHRLYLGGVADLDREVGLFVEELERRRWFERGAFVFTSDHGEAFAEHDTLFHARGTWEEVLRVPLLVRAPGLEPRRTRAAASLVDLAPTLAGLAGVEPAPAWRGRDVLATEAGAITAYDCAQGGDAGGVLVDGRWKLAFDVDAEGRPGAPASLFDLEHDPGEREDLVREEAARTRALLEAHGARLEELAVPLHAADRARLDEAERRRLEAMGYVDVEGP